MESPDRFNVSYSIGSAAAAKRRKAFLDDYMWIEILCRLSSAKSALRCKCVSKHWNSLISDKYFVTRFIEHHRENCGTNSDPDQILWFLTYSSKIEHTQITSGSCLLPRNSYRVECSFNDLLLCCDYKTNPRMYYIFNPFTKEQIELPVYEPDAMHSEYDRYSKAGFVCEPFYSQRCGVNASYRYRVLFIEYHRRVWNACMLVTYYFETRQWNVQTGLKRGNYRCVSNILGHNGKLYWYNLYNVVVYDPFVTATEPCFYHYAPIRKRSMNVGHRFHVVEGSVVFVEMSMNRVRCEVFISKLKKEGDGDHGKWCLERRIVLHKLFKSVGAPSFLSQVRYVAVDINQAYFTLLFCFHPSNRDVILLSDSTSFNTVSYNLRTKEWKMVGELVPFIYPGTHPSYDGGVLVAHTSLHIAATLPWWPTPVH